MNKTTISTNPETLNRYRTLIIPAYNKFVRFVDTNYDRVKQTDQYILDNALERAREVFVKCLENLQCKFTLPNDLRGLVNEQNVGPVPLLSQPGTSSSVLNVCQIHSRIRTS